MRITIALVHSHDVIINQMHALAHRVWLVIVKWQLD